MPWRLPVGLDALLPSCRACKAAALFVWHRHAGTASTRSAAALLCAFHFAPPRRRAMLHAVASPCSTPVLRLPVRLVLQGKVAPLRGCASVVPLLRSMGSPPFRSCGVASIPLLRGRLHFAPWGRLHSAPAGSPPLCSTGSPPLCSHRVASTLLHGRDDARKTADLRRRSPSPGGELHQKCEAMGTVALHRGFPLMRMIFFDKTPPWDPCLWGEVE